MTSFRNFGFCYVLLKSTDFATLFFFFLKQVIKSAELKLQHSFPCGGGISDFSSVLLAVLPGICTVLMYVRDQLETWAELYSDFRTPVFRSLFYGLLYFPAAMVALSAVLQTSRTVNFPLEF